MNRRTAIALVAYVTLVSLLLTPLYEPFTQGRDDSWAIALAIGCAHLGAGIGVRRFWVLALPIGFSVIAFFVGGAEALAWLILLFVMPALVVVTALGWGLGRLLRGSVLTAGTAGVFLIATLPALWAATEQLRRDEPLPASVQSQLPLKVSLRNLCAGSGTAGDSRFERKARVLLRELEHRPHHLVTYTYYWSDEPEEAKEITVHDLAEEQLDDLESGGENCVPELQRRLRDALD